MAVSYLEGYTIILKSLRCRREDGEANKNYWAQGVRNVTRGLPMLQMFWSLSVVSLSADCMN